jgi:predicted nucleic acid-binding protein
MTVFVPDSSAVLWFIDREAGTERTRAIFRSCAGGQDKTCISAVRWAEIAGKLRRRWGVFAQKRILESMTQLESTIISATAERAVRAAEIKADTKRAHFDAFVLDLAMDSPDHALVTADCDFKAVADLAQIEFLPEK